MSELPFANGSVVLIDIVEKMNRIKKKIPKATGIKCDMSARIEWRLTSLSFETK